MSGIMRWYTARERPVAGGALFVLNARSLEVRLLFKSWISHKASGWLHLFAILDLNIRHDALLRGLCRSRRRRGNCSFDLGKFELSWGVIQNVKVVNDQLRRTVIWGELNLNTTHDGNWRAVLDVVVLGKALVVMDREGAHFTGLLEDTCPDVVDVKLCVARFLEGVLGLHEIGVRVVGELICRARRQISPTWINRAENFDCITYVQCDNSNMKVLLFQS